MDSETKLDKHTKFKETFKVSKLKVKEWEKTFVDENGRKPTKDEMKNAPPQIQICYKNCWKIKSYFESKSIGNSDGRETSELLDETSVMPQTQSFDNAPEKEQKTETPCSDITNTKSALSKSVWGAHLNKKEPVKPTSTSFSFSGLSTKLDLALSQGSTTKTRTSLKKRNKTIQSFQSFTDTLGVLDDTDTVIPDPKPLPLASSQPDMFLSEDLFRSEESQEATVNAPASKELPGASSKETGKDDSDGEDSAVFPNWNLKHEPKERAPKSSSSKPLQSGLRRKVDSDWLSRCTGIATETPATNEKEELTTLEKGEQGVNLTNIRTSEEMEAKTVADTVKSSCPPKVVPESENDDDLPAQTLPLMSQANQPIVQNRKEEVTGEAEMVALTSQVNQKSKAVKRRNVLSSDEEEDSSQRDTAYEADNPSVEKTKKTKAVKRRKRGSSVEEDEEEFSLQTSKKTTKSKKPPRKRQKTTKKEEEEDQEKDVSQTEETQGPSDLNIYALGFEGPGVDNTNVRQITTAKERLEKKVLSGKANDNFVKIDLKKKKGFVKGKNSGARLKRAEWKRKLDMKEGRKVKEWKCYNCGEAGHMAWQCTGKR